jgi:hypothetical protein
MDKMDELAIKWSIAKQKEDAARDERVAIERQIIEVHPAREEGSETFATPNGVKVTLTGKLSYKVDLDKLTMLTGSWPADMRPIKIETKVDESKLKAIRSDAPDAWVKIAPAVTVTPAKTGVTVKFQE